MSAFFTKYWPFRQLDTSPWPFDSPSNVGSESIVESNIDEYITREELKQMTLEEIVEWLQNE